MLLAKITPTLVKDYCCEWCDAWGAPYDPNPTDNRRDDWHKVVESANLFINNGWGFNNPSPFKQAAATAMAIVAAAPIGDHPPQSIIENHELDQNMVKHPKILRAIVAHAFVCFILKGAVIGNGEPHQVLTNEINISGHYYRDLLWVLTRVSFENGKMFNPLSLIYEACAYQANPNARNQF